jgi:arginine/ornithine N-succinyltransferase beta subunit
MAFSSSITSTGAEDTDPDRSPFWEASGGTFFDFLVFDLAIFLGIYGA